jgi:hypothetical protein
MKTKPAGKLKPTCESVAISMNARTSAELVPAQKQSPDILGCLAGVMEIVGDIESPVVSPKVWKALR